VPKPLSPAAVTVSLTFWHHCLPSSPRPPSLVPLPAVSVCQLVTHPRSMPPCVVWTMPFTPTNAWQGVLACSRQQTRWDQEAAAGPAPLQAMNMNIHINKPWTCHAPAMHLYGAWLTWFHCLPTSAHGPFPRCLTIAATLLML